MRGAIIQYNPKVGDVDGNLVKIEALARKAQAQGATLAVFPEMAVIGYPPRDLLLYPFLIEEAERAVTSLAQSLADIPLTVIVGSAAFSESKTGRSLQNVAFVLSQGRIAARYAKRLLPTYDVFDEARYFEPGQSPVVYVHEGLRLALTICEDIWNDMDYWPRPLYRLDPLAEHPPFDILVNLSASPFSVAKQDLREDLLAALARRYQAEILYVNQVGANDELIFDGRSVHLDKSGRTVARAKAFEEDLVIVELVPEPAKNSADERGKVFVGPNLEPQEEIWAALVLGVQDYSHKNGLKTAVLGLSGGIDSALTACIAAEALGPQNVTGVLMPSLYSSEHSLKDALALIDNLKLPPAQVLNISPAMEVFGSTLAPCFGSLPPDTTEENIQARIRGVVLMAMANKFGSLLLTTGNKSEIAVGYCTLYGDMCGALAVIGDLYKTEVFRLARWLNKRRGRPVIPENTITKPPSAELRPNQTDQDSLPPYEELDSVLAFFLEDKEGPAALKARGFEPKIVKKVASLVRLAEFKRRQAAPVLRITAQAFGVGWRMPITCGSVFEERKKAAPLPSKV
ncbi:MAG: NAD+ synthase [Deltaproteobacteria bacterium]|nr:NAD+ synthase [Deltaproteobacteria bacterium]